MRIYPYILTAALAAVGVAGALALADNEFPIIRPFQVPTDKGIVEVAPITADIFRITTLPADSTLPFM